MWNQPYVVASFVFEPSVLVIAFSSIPSRDPDIHHCSLIRVLSHSLPNPYPCHPCHSFRSSFLNLTFPRNVSHLISFVYPHLIYVNFLRLSLSFFLNLSSFSHSFFYKRPSSPQPPLPSLALSVSL